MGGWLFAPAGRIVEADVLPLRVKDASHRHANTQVNVLLSRATSTWRAWRRNARRAARAELDAAGSVVQGT